MKFVLYQNTKHKEVIIIGMHKNSKVSYCAVTSYRCIHLGVQYLLDNYGLDVIANIGPIITELHPLATSEELVRQYHPELFI